MNTPSSELMKIVDPKLKDARWMTNIVSWMRRDWIPLVDPNRMAANKQIIFSQQDMRPIIKMFRDKNFKKETDFVPLGIWNRIVNIIVEEITKTPPKMELKANDATAISDRKEDILLLKYKGQHEKNINEQGAKIGAPPFIIGNEKFKSNVEEMERLGLNPADAEDVDFYSNSGYQRLNYEIAGQKLINIIMKLNRFDEETIRDFVYDILAGMACCIQCYVDQMTGEIKYDRVYPEEAYGIFSNKRDGSNDICQGVVKQITIREWLGRVGNEFEFERDWSQLLWALNYANNSVYTGFVMNNVTYSVWNNAQLGEQFRKDFGDGYQSLGNNQYLDYNIAYTYKISVGYMEFSSIDATATYLAKVKSGEIEPRQINYDYFLDDKKEMTEYYKESYYNEQMYKSYFIITSTTTQWIYNWGKVYYQQLYGAFDQYAKGTLFFYRMEGISAAEISKYYIDFANLAAYRLKWLAYHSKPEEDEIILPELVKVAKAMQRLNPQNDKNKAPAISNVLDQLINYRRENFVILRDYPEIEGKTIGQLHPLHQRQRGQDPMAMWMQAIEQWCESQIAEKVGLNDLRMGKIENARQGYKQGQEETQSSYNSTSYVFRMIQYTKEHIATTTLNYAQDIVRFEDSIPYNYLKKLMGENDFQNIKLLKDFAAHRYALTVENYNSQIEKQEMKMLAQRSMDTGDGRGGISLIEYGIVMGEDDWKKGLKLLSFFKYKAEKKKRKEEIQMMQIKQKNDMELKKADQETEQVKGNIILQKAKMDTDALKYSADKQYGAKVDTTNAKIEHEPTKSQTRVEGQKEIATHKSDLKAQEPLP